MATKMKSSVSVFVITVLLATSIQGQIIKGKPATIATGFVYTYWELATANSPGTTLGQLWMPLNGFVPLQEKLEARYYLAGSTNSFQVGNSKAYLNGLSDTRFEISRSFSENQFFISGGVNLPTGKTKLAFNLDRAIVEFLSESFLVFPMRRFGEGLGFNGTVGAAKSWGNTVAGIGISYDIIGKYTPYENFDEYNPGDVFTAELGINTHRAKTAVACGVNFLGYANDKTDGKKVFKQGKQVGLSISGAYENEKIRINPSAKYTIRGRNTRYESNTELIRDRLRLYGNELDLGLEVGRYFRGGWNFSPLFSILKIDNNEDNFGDSQVLSYGVSIGKRFSERILVGTWFKILSGDADNGRIDLGGYQISASLLAAL